MCFGCHIRISFGLGLSLGVSRVGGCDHWTKGASSRIIVIFGEVRIEVVFSTFDTAQSVVAIILCVAVWLTFLTLQRAAILFVWFFDFYYVVK